MTLYTTFELIHCLRARSLLKIKSGNQRVSLLSQCQNRLVGSESKLKLCRVRFWGGVCFSKMELEGRFKNGTQKCEEDEIKGIQKWSRNFRDILVLVYTMFPTGSLLRWQGGLLLLRQNRHRVGWQTIRHSRTVGQWVAYRISGVSSGEDTCD